MSQEYIQLNEEERTHDEAAENFNHCTIRFNDLTTKGRYKIAIFIQQATKLRNVAKMGLAKIVKALEYTNPTIIQSVPTYDTAYSQLDTYQTRRLSRCVYYTTKAKDMQWAKKSIEYATYSSQDTEELKKMKNGIEHWDENECCAIHECADMQPHYHRGRRSWREREYSTGMSNRNELKEPITDQLRERLAIYELISKNS